MQTKYSIIALTLLLVFSLIIRLPLVSSGLPYLYDEDEAHHHNRQIEMLKSGDLNPKYFLKPSLNFYLRLPVLSAGFLWTVKSGNILQVQDLQTRDKFGLANYSFTSSHPTLMKFNRAFTILLVLLCITFAFLSAQELTGKTSAGIFTGLILSVSPLLYEHSISVGVNIPAALFITIALWLSIKIFKSFSWKTFLLISAFAGLAVSSKYNALPVMILPILPVLQKSNFSVPRLLTAIFLPWMIFLAGSPYILAEIPLFLNNLAYEVWHYGVEGHVGHMAEPGLAQGLFFINNLCSYSLGLICTLMAAAGLILSAYHHKRLALPLAVFSISFFLMMGSQKANFDRNLLLVLPALAVFAGVSFYKLQEATQSIQLVLPLMAVFLIQPAFLSIQIFKNSFITDTRDEVYQRILNMQPAGDIAIDGELQLPLFVHYENGRKKISRRGVERIEYNTGSTLKYYLQGYDQFVLGPNTYNKVGTAERLILMNPEVYNGDPTPDRRIPLSPMAVIFSSSLEDLIKNKALPVVLNYSHENIPGLKTEVINNRCHIAVPAVTKDLFWVNSRVTPIDLSSCKTANLSKLHVEAMTPWGEQKFGLLNLKSQKELTTVTKVGEFTEYIFDLTEISKEPTYLYIDQIHSPKDYDYEDSRRLGIALLPG